MSRTHAVLNHPQTDPTQGHAPTAIIADVSSGIDVVHFDIESPGHFDALEKAMKVDLPFAWDRFASDLATIRGEYDAGTRPGFNGQVWRAVGILPNDGDGPTTLIVVDEDYASFIARNLQWNDMVRREGVASWHTKLAESPTGLPYGFGANVAIVGSIVAQSDHGPVILDQWRGNATNEPDCLAWTVGESLRTKDDFVGSQFDVVRSGRRCLHAEWGFQPDEVEIVPTSIVVESTGNVVIVIAGRTQKHVADMVRQVEGVGRNQGRLQRAFGTGLETLAFYATPIGSPDEARSAFLQPRPAKQIILSMKGDSVTGVHSDFTRFPVPEVNVQQMSSRPPAALAAITLEYGRPFANSLTREAGRLAQLGGVAVNVDIGRSSAN